MTVRRILVLPPSVRPETLRMFQDMWENAESDVARRDLMTTFDVKVIDLPRVPPRRLYGQPRIIRRGHAPRPI